MRYVIAMLLLAACGKEEKSPFECTHTYTDKVLRMVGPLEKAKCETGEVVLEAYLVYEPGGAPKWLNVQCAKQVTQCK